MFWNVVFKIHGMVKPMLVLGLFVSVICFEESSDKSMHSGFSGHWHGQGPLPVFDRAPSSPGVVNLYTSHIYLLGFSFYSLRGICTNLSAEHILQLGVSGQRLFACL